MDLQYTLKSQMRLGTSVTLEQGHGVGGHRRSSPTSWPPNQSVNSRFREREREGGRLSAEKQGREQTRKILSIDLWSASEHVQVYMNIYRHT